MVAVFLTQTEKGQPRHSKSAKRTPQSFLGSRPCAAGARQSSIVRYKRQRAPDSPQNEKMVDSAYRTRLLGVPTKGLRDQYADGAAARVWELYIGCTSVRTSQYKQWLTALLREHGCENKIVGFVHSVLREHQGKSSHCFYPWRHVHK